MPAINEQDKAIMEKLSGRTLNEQEVFENQQALLGAFNWLVEMDRKYNPEIYEN